MLGRIYHLYWAPKGLHSSILYNSRDLRILNGFVTFYSGYYERHWVSVKAIMSDEI